MTHQASFVTFGQNKISQNEGLSLTLNTHGDSITAKLFNLQRNCFFSLFIDLMLIFPIYDFKSVFFIWCLRLWASQRRLFFTHSFLTFFQPAFTMKWNNYNENVISKYLIAVFEIKSFKTNKDSFFLRNAKNTTRKNSRVPLSLTGLDSHWKRHKIDADNVNFDQNIFPILHLGRAIGREGDTADF